MKTIENQTKWTAAQTNCFVRASSPRVVVNLATEPGTTSTSTQSSGALTPAAPERTAGWDSPVPRWKRPLDVALVLLLLPAALPLFVLISLYIKLVSRGPVFFAQTRVGYKGKLFRCLKFRTMHVKKESGVHHQHLAQLINSDQPMKKLDNLGDARIIPLGRLVRACGLDELPQLINVLFGEMSLVGPRPCTPYEYELYKPWHKDRLLALPGMTGLWQVSGKNKTTFDEMVRLDIRYAKSGSFWQDAKIILRTLPALVGQAMEI